MIACVPEALALRDSVDRLGRALLAPATQDELIMWVLLVQDATQSLDAVLPRFLEDVLHSDYTDMARADVDLLPCVEQMTQAERRLLGRRDNFWRGLDHLAQRLPHVPGDELDVSEERRRVERLGIELLIELKQLQNTANTCLQEAIYRDRGPVD